MDMLVRVWLSQQCHAEASEVSPQEEVEGMESIRASTSMLLVVVLAKPPLG